MQMSHKKFLYTKLFDDGTVDYYQTDNQDCYKNVDETELRREAEKKFPHFLNTKIKDISNLFPFGDQFFALLVAIAYKSGSRSSPRTMPVAPLNFNVPVPFAACIKFAFDHSQTGKITALCGEVVWQAKNSNWKRTTEKR